MIAFFIDADNLCAPKWIDEAIDFLESSFGAICVKRAYGSAEKLKGLAEVCRARSIRPFVNLPLLKNTTDVALAVDAMALSYQTPCPAVVAIGSGDADFLPLVVRLRERGIRAICVSERGKMAQEAISAYENVVYVGEPEDEDQKSAQQKISNPSKVVEKEPTPIEKIATKALKAKSGTGNSGSSSKAVAKKATKKVANTPAAASGGPVTVEQFLEAIPQLREKGWLTLNTVAKQLRDKKITGKNASSAKLFSNHPRHFALDPKAKPTQVRYIG